MIKYQDRIALADWEDFHSNITRATPVLKETVAEAKKRKTHLEENPEDWFKYHFEKYCSAEPAAFHIKATCRILTHNRWFEVRAWSRELSKTTRTRFETIYQAMTGKIKNVLIISNTHDAAVRLLAPYKIAFELNARLIKDYGVQEKPGHWTKDEFTTLSGVSFLAIGWGENPRGNLNEEFRPDKIIFDDIDTDQECRNPEIIKNKWNWIEKAVLPTVSISGNWQFIFLGNLIAKDCCIARAMKKADHVDIINIRDKNGKSTWSKNSEADIDAILSKLSFAAAQGEYFNNPITEGTVFKEIQWDKCPPMRTLKFIIQYGDPAPSNRENKKNCYKGVIQLGAKDGTFYIYNCRLEHAGNDKFVNWYYELEALVDKGVQVYHYLENNGLQDPFYQQVFKPLFHEAGKQNGHYIYVAADERKKPDKFARIEGNLEPLNRIGKLIFNIDEKSNPHMQRLEEQFKSVDPQLSAPVDGPDAVEGGIYILNRKIFSQVPVELGRRNINHNKKRF